VTRRVLTVVACVLVLAVPSLNAWAAADQKATVRKKIVKVTKTVAGSTVPCKKWGPLQVALKIAQTRTTVGATTKVTFKILAVDVPLVPTHTVRSVFINKKALPLLQGEVMELQSGKIESIAGATDTTVSFKQSLQAALLAAKA
jgi:uncharacterized protein with FMN-binding domain